MYVHVFGQLEVEEVSCLDNHYFQIHPMVYSRRWYNQHMDWNHPHPSGLHKSCAFSEEMKQRLFFLWFLLLLLKRIRMMMMMSRKFRWEGKFKWDWDRPTSSARYLPEFCRPIKIRHFAWVGRGNSSSIQRLTNSPEDSRVCYQSCRSLEYIRRTGVQWGKEVGQW